MADEGQKIGADDLEFRQDAAKGGSTVGTEAPYSRTPDQLPPGGSPPPNGPGPSAEVAENAPKGLDNAEFGENTDPVFTDGWLIQKCQEMYNNSTDYLDSNITNFWERNLAHFHGEHAPGSLYKRGNYKRSRTFRPKTRANVKQQEAGLANAIFTTLSLVSIAPYDERNEIERLSAEVSKELLQYRLEHKMPWFLTVQGAFQDTKVYGICITHQFWSYQEDVDLVPAFEANGTPVTEKDPETGESTAMGEEVTVVREDKLCCDSVEPENFRFDAMCDWRDPAGTSPYIIRLVPMYAGEALEMMERKDGKTGQQRWRRYSLSSVLGTRRQVYDRTRQAREGRDRIDPADETKGNEFTTVWAHMNIIRVNGQDYVYWTMGTELVLTDPIKLTDEYPWLEEKERPFTVGYSVVEAHRNYPSGDVEQTAPLQEEINQIANQRLDNVKLVLNKRYFVKRGSQVDLDALIRNVPGGGVMMNDPERDVQTISTPDITGSSYQEQGVLGQEFDDLAGGFNASQAAQSGASVGGSQVASASAGAVQDYSIKIFIETWLEPTLRQLQRIEAMYETDQTILALAADKVQAYARYGVDSLTDDLLTKQLIVRVDVGMGNTDPMRKVERLIYGVSKAAELPGQAMRLKSNNVADEIFGSLGYRDASRFFMNDEEFAQFQEENPQGPDEMEIKMRELDIREGDNRARDERERMKIDREYGDRDVNRQAKAEEKLLDHQAKENQSERSDKTQREIAAGNLLQKTREQNMKQGSGI